MAEDWFTIVLRLALYLDMAAAFGVAMFGVYALSMTSDPWQLGAAIEYVSVHFQHSELACPWSA